MNALASILMTSPQAVAADTVVTVVARDALQTAADIALVVLGLFLVVLLLVLLVLLLQLRKLNGTLRSLGEKALGKTDPILERGKGVAENVEFISAVVRSDVERLDRTVRSLTARLQQASDHMEERIEEFNALMEVVQDEAEEIFIGTASTARGVKEGVRSLSDGGSARARRPSRGRDDLAPPAAAPHDEDEVFLTGAEEETAGEPPEWTTARAAPEDREAKP